MHAPSFDPPAALELAVAAFALAAYSGEESFLRRHYWVALRFQKTLRLQIRRLVDVVLPRQTGPRLQYSRPLTYQLAVPHRLQLERRLLCPIFLRLRRGRSGPVVP